MTVLFDAMFAFDLLVWGIAGTIVLFGLRSRTP